MFSAIYAALAAAFSWLVSGAVMKLIVCGLMYGAFALLFPLLLSLMPSWFSGADLSSAAAVFPPGMWYFLELFSVQAGLVMVFGAWLATFIIRRLPFIG